MIQKLIRWANQNPPELVLILVILSAFAGLILYTISCGLIMVWFGVGF